MIVVSGRRCIYGHAAIWQRLLPPWNMCIASEVRNVMGSADAALGLVLHLDPGSIGKVNVSLEVCDLYGVARCMCSGFGINNPPARDSRKSRTERTLARKCHTCLCSKKALPGILGCFLACFGRWRPPMQSVQPEYRTSGWA